MKVSIIIPIYNGAKFLEKNLFMLSKQTLEEIEFILVNDASTDNSLNICLAFKEVFPNKFVVINSEKNRGPGGARNIGISYAKGEYIGFMDQDDYLHPEMLEELYKKAKEDDCDIVSCGFRNKQTEEDIFQYDLNGVLDDEKRLKFSSEILYIWNKIYKKDMIDKMSMLFREKVSNDDTDFCIEAILRANKVGAVGKCYYYYSFNKNSVTRKNEVDIKKQLAETSSLFSTLKKRVYNAKMERLFPQIIDKPLNVYAKGILKFIFDLEKLDYEYFKEYMNIFDEYEKYLCKFKNMDSDLLEDVIFNQIDENIKESFQRLCKLKEMINKGGLINI